MNKSKTQTFETISAKLFGPNIRWQTYYLHDQDQRTRLKKTLEPCYSSKLMKWRQGYFLYGNLNKLIFMFLAIFGEKFQKIVKWALWSCWGENLAARKHFCWKSLKQNISLFPKLVEAFTNPFSYLAAFLSLFLTLINIQSAN